MVSALERVNCAYLLYEATIGLNHFQTRAIFTVTIFFLDRQDISHFFLIWSEFWSVF